jgi:excisionase family DNA binding protein
MNAPQVDGEPECLSPIQPPLPKRAHRPIIVAGLRRYLSIKEASFYLDCGTRTIVRMIEEGVLSAHRLGGRLKFRQEDLDRALEPVHAASVTENDLEKYINQKIRPAAS